MANACANIACSHRLLHQQPQALVLPAAIHDLHVACSHRKKRMRQIKKMMQRGLLDPEQEDPFSLFVASTNIRYCYYHDTHKVLGNTFGMCVLQVRRSDALMLCCWKKMQRDSTGAHCAALCQQGQHLQQVRSPGVGDASDARHSKAQGSMAPRPKSRLSLLPQHILAACSSLLGRP